MRRWCPSNGGGGDGGGGTTDIVEKEPNDGPGLNGMQALGTLDPSKPMKVTGKLSSGGNDGMKYTGDADAFTFDVPTGGGSVAMSIDWTGSADVDLYLYDEQLQGLANDSSTGKPIDQTTKSLAAGKYAIALYSKDQPADWTMKLTFTAGGGDGGAGGDCIDVATLAATWWSPQGNGLLEQIKFYENGSCDYEYYNSTSGTSPYSGTYTLSCPTITANLQGGSNYTFTISGGRLYKDGYKWIPCTQPVSSGKCF